MGGYAGADRRRSTSLTPNDRRHLLTGAAFAGAVGLALVACESIESGSAPTTVGTTAAAATATTALLAAAATWVLLHRVTHDPRTVNGAVATMVLAISAVVTGVGSGPFLLPAIALQLPAAALLAEMTVLAEVDTTKRSSRRTGRALTLSVGGAGLLSASGPSATGMRVLALVGWLLAAFILGNAARRTERFLLAAMAVASGALAAAAALGLSSSGLAPMSTDALVAVTAIGISLAVMAEVQRAHRDHHAAAFRAMAEATAAARRARAVDEHHAERLHEARASLAGIGAASRTLNTYRALLDAKDYEDLTASLVVEVDRLRAMIEGDFAAANRGADPDAEADYALLDALAPAVNLARSSGMTVALRVADDLRALGNEAALAQVARELLDNARTHAPGAPVEIDADQLDDEIILTVADHGPGLLGDAEAIFERGATTGGTGLGLYVARQRLAAAGGSIVASPRAGGGAVFTIRLIPAHWSPLSLQPSAVTDVGPGR